MIPLAVALVVVLVVAVAIVLAKRVNQPEDAASHDQPDTETTSERFYAGSDRPAGPDVDDFVSPDEQAEADGAIRASGSAEEEHQDGAP